MFLGYDEVLKVHYPSMLHLGANRSRKEHPQNRGAGQCRCLIVNLAQNNHLANVEEVEPFTNEYENEI